MAASVAKTDQKKQKDVLRKNTLQIFFLKCNDAKKVTFETLTDFKQNHYKSWKYYKSVTFESLFHLSHKNT